VVVGAATLAFAAAVIAAIVSTDSAVRANRAEAALRQQAIEALAIDQFHGHEMNGVGGG